MGASGSQWDQARGNVNAGNGAGALTNLYNKMLQDGTYGGQQSMTGSSSSWGRDMDMRKGKDGNGSAAPGVQAGSGLSDMQVGINPPRPYNQSGGMMNRQIRQGK